eukprot:gb/GECG01003653.1/.p1 GENE.gb/GECG01003653.1/~~gb/GECG01003653.1/.p1  ORF type:complete len:1237 (+),score=134.36 gb/GECG01003653.1/:1-3711(+)
MWRALGRVALRASLSTFHGLPRVVSRPLPCTGLIKALSVRPWSSYEASGVGEEQPSLREVFEESFRQIWVNSSSYKGGDNIPEPGDYVNSEAFVQCAQVCPTRGDFHRLLSVFNEAKALRSKGILDHFCYISLAELCARFGDEEAVLYVMRCAVKEEGLSVDRGTVCVLLKALTRLDSLHELYSLMCESGSLDANGNGDTRLFLFEMCLDGHNGRLGRALMEQQVLEYGESTHDLMQVMVLDKYWKVTRRKLNELGRYASQRNTDETLFRGNLSFYRSQSILRDPFSSDLLRNWDSRELAACIAELCPHCDRELSKSCTLRSILENDPQYGPPRMMDREGKITAAMVCAHCRLVSNRRHGLGGEQNTRPALQLYEQAIPLNPTSTLFANAFLLVFMETYINNFEAPRWHREELLSKAITLHSRNCKERLHTTRQSVYDYVDPCLIAMLVNALIEEGYISRAFEILKLERKARNGKWLSDTELASLFCSTVCKTPTQYQRLLSILHGTPDIHDVVRLKSSLLQGHLNSEMLSNVTSPLEVHPRYTDPCKSPNSLKQALEELPVLVKEFEKLVLDCVRKGFIAMPGLLVEQVYGFMESMKVYHHCIQNTGRIDDTGIFATWNNAVDRMIVLINTLLQLLLPPICSNKQMWTVASTLWKKAAENTEELLAKSSQCDSLPLSFVDINSFRIVGYAALQWPYASETIRSDEVSVSEAIQHFQSKDTCFQLLTPWNSLSKKLECVLFRGHSFDSSSPKIHEDSPLTRWRTIVKLDQQTLHHFCRFSQVQGVRILARQWASTFPIDYPTNKEFTKFLILFESVETEGASIDPQLYTDTAEALCNAGRPRAALHVFWTARNAGMSVPARFYRRLFQLVSSVPFSSLDLMRVYWDLKKDGSRCNMFQLPEETFVSILHAVARDLREHGSLVRLVGAVQAKPWFSLKAFTTDAVYFSLLDALLGDSVFDLSPFYDGASSCILGTSKDGAASREIPIRASTLHAYDWIDGWQYRLEERPNDPIMKLEDFIYLVSAFQHLNGMKWKRIPRVGTAHLREGALEILTDIHDCMIPHSVALQEALASLVSSMGDSSSAQRLVNSVHEPSIRILELCVKTMLSQIPRRSEDNARLTGYTGGMFTPGTLFLAISKGEYVEGGMLSREGSANIHSGSPSWIYWLKVSAALRLKMLQNNDFPTEEMYKALLSAGVRRGHVDRVLSALQERRAVKRLRCNPLDQRAHFALRNSLAS